MWRDHSGGETMNMQSNVGKTDAVIRYIIGAILLLAAILVDSPWRWLGLIGIIPIVTAAVNFCPVWRLFGINTQEHEHGPQSHVH
jgi:hypothetical protein